MQQQGDRNKENEQRQREQNRKINVKEKGSAVDTFSMRWSSDLWAVWVTEEQ